MYIMGNTVFAGNLASSYFDENKIELAITTYQKAIQFEPNFPDAYNNLGNALCEIGQLDQAVSLKSILNIQNTK